MIRALLLLIGFTFLLPAQSILPDAQTFRFPASDYFVTYTIPVPEGARDFSRARSFWFDFRADSTIYFNVRLKNSQGRTTTYRLNPWEGVAAKAVIPGRILTREFMNNQSHQGYMISNWATHIDLTDVREIDLSMKPNRDVTVVFGPAGLSDQPMQDRILEPKPLVDQFGQWLSSDWPGKVTSLESLQTLWTAEQRSLAKDDQAFGWSKYGGWNAGPRQVASGFFRTVKLDGRWWLVDPEGYLFWSVGMDCVRDGESTPVEGREFLYQWLPPVDPGRRGAKSADFYAANAQRRFGNGWRGAWKSMQEARLRSWGFNTIGNWSAPLMMDPAKLPYVTNVSLEWSGRNWVGYPDTFSPEYLDFAKKRTADAVAPRKDDPFLIGWFVGNEPRWHERGLVQVILNDPDTSATRVFCQKYLTDHGDTQATRETLLEELARQFYRVSRDAVRAADPNHMVLGIRYAGSVPDPVLRANDVFDLFSINIYQFAPDPKRLEAIAKTLDKPVLIGEFHFGAAGRGMAPSLVMVKDQEQRGVAYRYYVEQAAAMPFVVGAHYFQHIDQAVTGRFDGEYYNLGFVTQQDTPYAEMVSASRAAAKDVYEVHRGSKPPYARKAAIR